MSISRRVRALIRAIVYSASTVTPMPLNTAVLYSLRFGGRFFDEEHWECGVHMGSDTNHGTAAAYRQAVTDWIIDPNSKVSSAASLDYVKRNAIDQVTGRYIDQTFSDTSLIAGQINGAGAAMFAQLSLASTLTTAQIRGRGHEGRFYPPSGGLTPSGDGHILNTVAASVAVATVGLINNLNAVDPTNRVVIWSAAAHIMREVTGVRIGNVVDTQRRRRRQMHETYTKQSLTA